MKILFFTSDKFPPIRVDVSVLFAKYFILKNHGIDFVLQSNGNCNKKDKKLWNGCNVFIGPTDNGNKKINRIKKHLLDIYHDLTFMSKKNLKKYDLIIIKDKFISPTYFILKRKNPGIKVIYWLSYPFPEASIYRAKEGSARYPYLYLLRGYLQSILLYKIILPNVDHAFVQSDQMKKDILKKFKYKNKLTPVPMGVEFEKIPFFSYNENSGSKDFKTIVYLGTILRVRKIDFLVRVLDIVKKKEMNAVLKIVGGPVDILDELVILDEAKKYGIESSIIITGKLDQNEAWKQLENAAVCVSPFYPTPILNSTSPTKLIEYMALGKVVVANDHPEQKKVIEESGAGICVKYNEEEFAEAIIYLLQNVEESKIMGIKGREYVKKFRSYEKISSIVERKIKETLR